MSTIEILPILTPEEVAKAEGKKYVKIVKNEKYEATRASHKAAVKKYYDKHKNEKYTCPICLGSITFSNKYHHNNSNKHLAWVNKLKDEELKKIEKEEE